MSIGSLWGLKNVRYSLRSTLCMESSLQIFVILTIARWGPERLCCTCGLSHVSTPPVSLGSSQPGSWPRCSTETTALLVNKYLLRTNPRPLSLGALRTRPSALDALQSWHQCTPPWWFSSDTAPPSSHGTKALNPALGALPLQTKSWRYYSLLQLYPTKIMVLFTSLYLSPCIHHLHC